MLSMQRAPLASSSRVAEMAAAAAVLIDGLSLGKREAKEEVEEGRKTQTQQTQANQVALAAISAVRRPKRKSRVPRKERKPAHLQVKHRQGSGGNAARNVRSIKSTDS